MVTNSHRKNPDRRSGLAEVTRESVLNPREQIIEATVAQGTGPLFERAVALTGRAGVKDSRSGEVFLSRYARIESLRQEGLQTIERDFELAVAIDAINELRRARMENIIADDDLFRSFGGVSESDGGVVIEQTDVLDYIKTSHRILFIPSQVVRAAYDTISNANDTGSNAAAIAA